MSKFCVRCKNAIDTTTERYKKIEDHNEGKLIKKVYMHDTCWKEFVVKKKQEGEILSMARQMMGKITGGTD